MAPSTVKGDRRRQREKQRLPPNHPYLNGIRRQRERERERPSRNHLYLNERRRQRGGLCSALTLSPCTVRDHRRGQRKGERERDHHPTTSTLTIEGERERDHHPTTLTSTKEGDRERERPPPSQPSHPYLNDRRRQGEREILPPSYPYPNGRRRQRETTTQPPLS